MYCIVLYCILSNYFMLYHTIILHYTILYYIILHYIILYYVMYVYFHGRFFQVPFLLVQCGFFLHPHGRLKFCQVGQSVISVIHTDVYIYIYMFPSVIYFYL